MFIQRRTHFIIRYACFSRVRSFRVPENQTWWRHANQLGKSSNVFVSRLLPLQIFFFFFFFLFFFAVGFGNFFSDFFFFYLIRYRKSVSSMELWISHFFLFFYFLLARSLSDKSYIIYWILWYAKNLNLMEKLIFDSADFLSPMEHYYLKVIESSFCHGKFFQVQWDILKH